MWIDDSFPRLASEGYQITSEPNAEYNCIAYAVGETDRWWTYLDGYYWPESASRGALVQSLIQAFSELDYELCPNAHEEPSYEKIALYADSAGEWTHAAIQLPGGAWSSKLGEYEDISHQTPESLAGALYGGVHCIMRRRKRP